MLKIREQTPRHQARREHYAAYLHQRYSSADLCGGLPADVGPLPCAPRPLEAIHVALFGTIWETVDPAPTVAAYAYAQALREHALPSLDGV